MADIPFNFFLGATILSLFSFIGGWAASRAKLSPLIGYIAAGSLMGLIFGSQIPLNLINNFSYFGLILLVFTLGLETNFKIINQFGRFVVIGGLWQIFLSAIAIFSLSLFFNFNLLESVIFGFAFALSSTAVVAKIIQDKAEENSLLGSLAVGILIFQDLAFIPLLIILTSLGQGESSQMILGKILINTIKSGLILIFVYYVGQKGVKLLFDRVAKLSRELLNLFIMVFILIVLALFSYFNISTLLAAFIAGVLLGQTFEHYHIFSQIRPSRDLLAVVFFVFLGLSVDLGFMFYNIIPILSYALILILIKALIILGIYLFYRFHSRIAFSLASYLFQIGEYAFIILLQVNKTGTIGSDSFKFALGVVVITLLLTPYIISNKDGIYSRLRKIIKSRFLFLENFIVYKFDREAPNIDVLPLKNHIVICGYGRVGSYIGRALTLANFPFIAIDFNLHVVEKAKKESINIIYGDPTEIDVLDYAECDQASVMISTVPDLFSQETIIFHAKKLNPKLIILSRVHQDSGRRRLRDLGVEVVIQPEFEASLSIIRKVLYLKGLDREEIARKIKRLKIEHGMI